jgi:polyisoprenoid-binding protein YceI
MAASDPLSSPAVQTLLNEASLTGNWVLDSSRSKVELNTRHTWGLRPVQGVFREISGMGTVSATGEVSGTLKVAAASIDTKNNQRDKDLRSPRFFDVSRYPDITFTVDRFTTGADGVAVNGKLTVRDRTRPLGFPVRVSVLGQNEVALDGEAQINRKEFGLSFSFVGMASMENTLVVHALFTRR